MLAEVSQARRSRRIEPPAGARTEMLATGPAAVYRAADDDQVNHLRCRAPLSFRGVRGQQEADFYCLSCMTTVTVPVIVLMRLPISEPPVTELTLVTTTPSVDAPDAGGSEDAPVSADPAESDESPAAAPRKRSRRAA